MLYGSLTGYGRNRYALHLCRLKSSAESKAGYWGDVGGTKGLASGFNTGGGEELLRKAADPSAGEALAGEALTNAGALGPRPGVPATAPCM